jgi:hypothetical protein
MGIEKPLITRELIRTRLGLSRPVLDRMIPELKRNGVISKVLLGKGKNRRWILIAYPSILRENGLKLTSKGRKVNGVGKYTFK